MKYQPPLDGDIGDLNRPYIDANPAYGIQGSIPPANAIEHPQREIENVITESGLTPSEDDLTQLFQAITIIVEENIPEMPEIPQAFPTGTTMLFAQTAAPSGWTKIVDAGYNQRALRLVTGNASSGGNLDFTSAFSNKSFNVSLSGNVGYTTLSNNQMPRHKHVDGLGYATSWGDRTFFGYTLRSKYVGGDADGFNNYNASVNTSTEGGSYAHNHPLDGNGTGSIDLRVKYLDVIAARKD